MRLLFLYIEDYRVHRQRGISFDSNDVLSFEDGVLSYKHHEVLPPDFFGKVESVSAVIGENGTGKTSLVSFLDDIFASGRSDRKPKFLLVYAVGHGKDAVFYCRDNLVKEPIVRQVEEKVGETRFRHRHFGSDEYIDPLPFTIFYYSPYYSIQHVVAKADPYSEDFFARRFVDISTSALLRERSENSEDCFDKDERKRLFDIVRLLGSKADRMPDGMPMPAPGHVTVYVSEKYAINAAENFRARAKRYLPEDREKADLLLRVSESLSIANHPEPLLRIFAGYVASTFANFIDCDYDSAEEYLLRLTEAAKVASLESIRGVACDQDAPEDLVKRHRAWESILSVWSELRSGGRAVENGLGFDIVDQRQSEALYRLMAAGDVISTIDGREGQAEFLTVAFGDASAGEMAFLTLFARLEEVKKGLKLGEEGVLLFLDEAETTLHPDWQRKLVKTVVWFLENFVAEKTHVIFASHSPMLLSDVPIGNVHFLPPKSSKENVKAYTNGMRRLRNTFGSNIFDLYRFAFDLTGGTIGAFAEGKIKELLDVAKSDKVLSQDQKKVLKLIGDGVIAAYLSEADRRKGFTAK